MKFAALFLWLIVPGAAYGGYVLYGLPHVIWSYSFEDNGDRYNPLAHRHYIDCTFIGPYGGFTVPAEAGRCAWVKLFKRNSRHASLQ